VARTTSAKVQKILRNDYETGADLEPYVRAAGLITDRVATCATDKGEPLTAAELAEVEGWVAAMLYTKSDRVYTSRSTSGVSGSFQVEGNPYYEGALTLDPSGCLKSILSGQRAGGDWLGKAVPDQLDYDTRN
jgi:hypothetical protein